MIVKPTDIEGCFRIDMDVYSDLRGSFTEVYQQNRFAEAIGLRTTFVQDNQSVSKKGVLRGLHYQKGSYAQAKLVRVVSGAVQDVIVDIRPHSPSFGKYISMELTGPGGTMVFIPKGVAHGFLALEDNTVFCYKCDAYYNPGAERGIRFDDKILNIPWRFPKEELIVSDKDCKLPIFETLLK